MPILQPLLSTLNMSLIVSCEEEFNDWFKRHLELFGYQKALSDYKGIYQSPFPDYWCITNDMKAERVELETLSYHFVLHQHDPKLVDRVICVENNHWLYGLDLPDNFITLNGMVVDGYQSGERCIWRAQKALNPKKQQPSALLAILRWRIPKDSNLCFYCRKQIKGYTAKSVDSHSVCIEKAQEWLKQVALDNKSLYVRIRE